MLRVDATTDALKRRFRAQKWASARLPASPFYGAPSSPSSDLTRIAPGNLQIVNDVARRGFVVGWDALPLGDALSCIATLFVLSRRTGIPTFYPYADRYGDLFPSLPKLSRVYVPAGLDKAALARLLERSHDLLETLPTLSGIQGASFEELGNARVRGVVWISRHEGDLRDWRDGDAEQRLKVFCRRGNGVILNGSYWRQYTDMRELARDGDALRRHLGPLRTPIAPDGSDGLARPEASLRIGLHMRLGDYRVWQDGRYFFDDEAYGSVAQAIHRELGEQPHTFEIFSDQAFDPQHFANLPATFGGGDLFDDFARLSRCDLVVGPPSTFSTWAAFLGRAKRIVLTRARLDGAEPFLGYAVEIPFPTGSYIPGDDKGGPI